MAENVKTENNCTNIGEIKEYGLTLTVCTNSTTPRKTHLYYDKELQLERLLIANLLSEYVCSGKSILKPVKCLDANGGAGVNGLLWKKYIPDDSINVSITTQHSSAIQHLEKNAERNGLNVNIVKKDVCVLLHEEGFNFIHIDCHTSASCYLDAAFRNLPRNGVLVITTKDDCSLQGRNPSAAVRNYGGFLTKTMYSTELGIRLVIAAMARSAAKYNKAVEVICCAAFKSSFMVAVTATKGSLKTDKALENVRRLLHCTVCEQRCFYPTCDDGSVRDNSSLLKCSCSNLVNDSNINVAAEFGPIWCGEIFNVDYLKAMMKHENIPSRELVNSFISLLLNEAMVTNYPRRAISEKDSSVPSRHKKIKLDTETVEEEISDNEDNSEAYEHYDVVGNVMSNGVEENVGYRLQIPNRFGEQPESEDCITSPFYYNLPFHTPKIPHQVPIDKVIVGLSIAGFRASRTHFDREAVRTNASCNQLINIIESLSSKT